MKKEFKNFGDFCLLARKQKGMSQKTLAEKLSWGSGQFVSNIERGICSYPLNKFKLLARTLKIDLRQLTDVYAGDEIRRIEKEVGL
ncbi:MAG TPA: helix-turn-helix transcriptional regulator [Nitrosopumilaceae archaeon]|jgi:transcriptional regulator with XRE-family HTH domain|nr:helix-turn-helix transcriptional regulator [Nitrosopumilaceae archaeon]